MSSDFFYEYDDLKQNTNLPMTTSAMKNSGLKIFLPKNPHRKINNRKLTECRGSFLTIHSPDDLPTSFEDDYQTNLQFGSSTEILITPKLTQTDDGLRSFSPSQRQCYFEGERKLKFYKIYTQSNCEFECLSMRLVR
jgi:Amiloride-sensitive sodium channel